MALKMIWNPRYSRNDPANITAQSSTTVNDNDTETCRLMEEQASKDLEKRRRLLETSLRNLDSDYEDNEALLCRLGEIKTECDRKKRQAKFKQVVRYLETKRGLIKMRRYAA